MTTAGTSYRRFFFDLDGTLARSRQPFAEAHADLFNRFMREFDVIIVSGSEEKLMRTRLAPVEPRYFLMSQNGNHAETPSGEVLWHRALTDVQKQAILSCVSKMRQSLAHEIRDENDLVEDRGCQIAYSLLGHNEQIEVKERFDPDFTKRRALASVFAEELQVLAEAHDIDMRIGGTTNMDFFLKGRNKGYNVAAMIEHMGWQRGECVYFGDALFPGGNDETVVGIIDTRPVSNYMETFAILGSEFGMKA